MSPTQALQHVERLKTTLSSSIPPLSFHYRVYAPEEPFKKWHAEWRDFLPDSKSGVYFFAWPADRIVYIGKAKNLGAEIWRKLEVPKRGDFYQHAWVGIATLPPELQGALLRGDMAIMAVEVEPPELHSLIEVALQTISCRDEGRLPMLNRQIG